MSNAAAIKIVDDQGNLIGKIKQVRMRGRQMWEALGKDEGRYVSLGMKGSRIEATDAIKFLARFGW